MLIYLGLILDKLSFTDTQNINKISFCDPTRIL